MRSRRLIQLMGLVAGLQLWAGVPATYAQPGPDAGSAQQGHNAAAPPGALTPIEQRIVAQVDARAEEAVSFLGHVVDINSGTGNLDGVRTVSRDFSAPLQALGFRTR